MSDSMSSHDMRIAGVGGLLSIALGTVAGIADQMWRLPSTGSPAAEITAYASAHRTVLLTAMVLNTAAVSLWLVFGAGVWLHLRQATRGESLLPACFLVGLVSFVTLLFAGFTAAFVLTYRAPDASESRL